MTTTCPIPNCKEHALETKPLCIKHWPMVPRQLQEAIYRTSSSLRLAKGPNLRSALRKKLREELYPQAIAAVTEKVAA